MRMKFLKMMKSSAHLALCRMRDLLAKDMIEKNVFKKETTEFDLKEVVEEITDIMRINYEHRKIEIISEVQHANLIGDMD